MNRRKLTAGLACLLLAGSFVFPSYASDFIAATDLAEISDDENVRIVSARKPADYAKVHIENAVNVYHTDLYQEGDVKGLLKSPEEIAAVLGAQGISESNKIVVYDGGKNTPSGRLYWILKYMGAPDVHILDGQMKQWRKARKSVTKKVPEFEAVTFTPTLNTAIYATIDDVKKEGVLLVDVRSQEEYDGEKGEAARKGHIPGAIHFEYKNVLNEDDTIKTKEELESLTADAGISADKEIVLYCETSIRAGIVFAAFTSILEFPNVRVYDGALYEWAADPNNPLE